jgi:hypothetical protein
MAVVPASNVAAKIMSGIAPRVPNQRILLSFFYESELKSRNILPLHYTAEGGEYGEDLVKMQRPPGQSIGLDTERMDGNAFSLPD